MRDTEASANFSKQWRFAGVAIHTCTYGPGNKLIMGIKAVMNEVFLDDLADETRLRYVKDPDTGKRVSQPNPEER